MNTLLAAKNIYFIGIKGWGMTALAQVLQSMGKTISGSDVTEKFLTDDILKKLSIPFYEGFDAAHISSTQDLVIASAAWTEENNVEVMAARQQGVETLSYPKALGLLSESKKSIGIAGTHGKTTTTALLGLAMIEMDLDPSVIVGSQVPQFDNANAHTGQGNYLVAETCEYRRHFLNFHPTAIIITNIEEDHLDYFQDLEDIITAFEEYVASLPSNGILVACIDNHGVRTLLKRIARKDIQIITYGESAEADFRLINHTVGTDMQTFQVNIANKEQHVFEMLIPGKHNCLNATAVIAMALNLATGKDKEQVIAHLQHAIKNFTSTTRRLQYLGKINDTLIYDDFGHHPTEIEVTLQALKDFYPQRKLIVSFMPHTYTRTEALLDKFAQAFKLADEVLINEIYASARESPIEGITGERLAQETSKYHPEAKFMPVDQVAKYIQNHSQTPHLFLTIGAGDNWKISHHLLNLL